MSDPKRLTLTDEECLTILAKHAVAWSGSDTYKLPLYAAIRAAVKVGERRSLQRAAEIARAHPIEKPHHRYSHWIDIHPVELRELIAAAIDREREEARQRCAKCGIIRGHHQYTLVTFIENGMRYYQSPCTAFVERSR